MGDAHGAPYCSIGVLGLVLTSPGFDDLSKDYDGGVEMSSLRFEPNPFGINVFRTVSVSI